MDNATKTIQQLAASKMARSASCAHFAHWVDVGMLSHPAGRCLEALGWQKLSPTETMRSPAASALPGPRTGVAGRTW